MNKKRDAVLFNDELMKHILEARVSLFDYASKHSLDELLTLSLDIVGELVQSPIGFYHFVGSDQKTLVLQQWSTRTLKDFCGVEGKGLQYSVDQAGVWVDCLRQRKAVVQNDYESLLHKKGMTEGHAKVVRGLAVPIFREGNIVAILSVGNKPDDYTQQDVRIVSYFADVTWEIVNQKRIEGCLRKTTYDLRERNKELNCLHSISKLIENDDLTIDGIIQEIANLIPPSWQYPEITCARIILQDRSFRTSPFKETELVQLQKIRVNKEHIGSIEVFLLETLPNKHERPFLVEEQHLLASISERVGRYIERKLALEQLQRSHKELQERVAERTKELAAQNLQLLSEIERRKTAEEEIKEFSEKIKLFAYSIAHDLKNPAISVRGLTKLLNKKYGDIFDEKGKIICMKIQNASDDIFDLVNQINLFISTKETPLFIKNINLKKVLNEISKEFAEEFKNRSIILSISGNVPDRLIADRLSVKRIFWNIIENALKYGGNELSSITIDHQETDNSYIFTITDDGKGLEDSDYDYIFSWFKRRTPSNGTQGAGMGLAIIREIIALHGGEIWYESGEKKGVSFCFSLNRYLEPTD